MPFVKDGFALKDTLVNRYILESDVLVNLPVAKNHDSVEPTLGMKNLMGISGDNRGRWHWQLHESIADINRVVISHLTVIDATYLMLQNGPTGGSTSYLKRLDTIIASANVVAADSEGVKLFGRQPKDIAHIALAEKAGIGRTSGYTAQTTRL